jgi:hypothetical protein
MKHNAIPVDIEARGKTLELLADFIIDDGCDPYPYCLYRFKKIDGKKRAVASTFEFQYQVEDQLISEYKRFMKQLEV